MLTGSGCKGQMETAMAGWGAGLWFHYQLIRLQQASVALFPLEARKSILKGRFGGKKCDSLNGHAAFAFKCEKFCLSIQLNGKEQRDPQ